VCTQARGVVTPLVRRGTLRDRDTSFPGVSRLAPFPGVSRLAPHEIPQHQRKPFDNDGSEDPDRERSRLCTGPDIDLEQSGWRRSLSKLRRSEVSLERTTRPCKTMPGLRCRACARADGRQCDHLPMLPLQNRDRETDPPRS